MQFTRLYVVVFLACFFSVVVAPSPHRLQGRFRLATMPLKVRAGVAENIPNAREDAQMRNCSLLVAAVLMFPLPASPQAIIPDDETCPGCIVVEHGVSFGGEDDLVSPVVVRRDLLGRWLVAPARPGELPRIYSADGTSLQTIGRVGEGPNEYRDPVLVTPGLGDTLLVFDRLNGRATVIGPDLLEVRTIVPGQVMMTDAKVLPRGQLVIASFASDEEGAGMALQVYEPNDVRPSQYLDSYAFEDPRLHRGARAIAVGKRGFCSIVQAYSYSFTCYNLDGEETGSYERETGHWYRATNPRDRSITPDIPPPTEMIGGWIDDGGYLWVIGSTRDPNHARGLSQPGEIEGQVGYAHDYQKVHDSVVEVIDLETAHVVSRMQFDTFFFGVASRGYVYSEHEDDLGWWIVRTYRLSLEE